MSARNCDNRPPHIRGGRSASLEWEAFIKHSVVIYKGSIKLWISKCIIVRQINRSQRASHTSLRIHHGSRPLRVRGGKQNRHDAELTERGMMDDAAEAAARRLLGR